VTPPPENSPDTPVTIARIEIKLDNALAAHAEHKREVARVLDDHEERLRTGERWRWAVPLTLLVALASAGGSYANLLGK
jgi:hypothetical protein